MDIFEYAMQMELDGERFYRDLAAKSEEPGFRNIFTLLAEDEVKHYHTFSQLKTGMPVMPESDILPQAKNIFAEITGGKQDLHFSGSQLEFYKTAREIEKKSQEFYTEKANEMTEPRLKELLLQIAKEEEQHYFLLYNIIELVLRPQTWVENGEFVHLDEY